MSKEVNTLSRATQKQSVEGLEGLICNLLTKLEYKDYPESPAGQQNKLGK